MLKPEAEGNGQTRWAGLRVSADDISIIWEHTAPGGVLQPAALYTAGDTLALSVSRSDGVSGFLNIADDSLLVPRRLPGNDSMHIMGIMETSCAGGGPAVLVQDAGSFIHEISLPTMATQYSTPGGEYRVLQDNNCSAVAVLDDGGLTVPSLDMALSLETTAIVDAITLDAAAGLQGLLL